MGVTAMIKAVLLLAWLWVVGAQRPNSAGIIFPGQTAPVSSNRQPGISINRQSEIGNKPRCTNNLEVDFEPCLEDEDYNANVRARFQHLLRRFRGNEVVTNEVFQSLSQPEIIDVELGERNNPGIPACASREEIIHPKRARTQSNTWVFVLNQGKNKQAVKVEKCITNNRPCNLGAARTEVDSVCRQKYIYKKLLVMNGAGTDIVPESVLMPSCCVCYIKKVVDNGFFSDFERSGTRDPSQMLSEDLDSVKDLNLTTEMSTIEETTLVPTTEKEPHSIIF